MPYCCRLSVDGLENEKMLEAAVLLVCVLLPGTTSYSYRNIWERFHYASSRKKKSDYCVQLSSVAESCPTLCDPMDCSMQASLSITNSWSLLKLTSIELVMPSNQLILWCPLFLPPSIFPSIKVFSNESVLRIRWTKYWSFSFSISPSSEYLGLIYFRIDWLDLLEVQGTLKSLLQHHSSKASIFWLSAFFIIQLSHPYMTRGKP